ncbi:MAG TPA: hypothetical protein VL484_11015 [Vicinamibacterales bacterium]|nr:hypothetical protein [Vicinamibacterales bacterium]
MGISTPNWPATPATPVVYAPFGTGVALFVIPRGSTLWFVAR